MVKKIAAPTPYVYQPYPRWICGLDGNRKIVQNHEHEERETGVRMNPDGTVFVEDGPHPPTLEEVRAAGYTHPGAAERIVAHEQEAFEKGYPPYGTNQRPPPMALDEALQKGFYFFGELPALMYVGDTFRASHDTLPEALVTVNTQQEFDKLKSIWRTPATPVVESNAPNDEMFPPVETHVDIPETIPTPDETPAVQVGQTPEVAKEEGW